MQGHPAFVLALNPGRFSSLVESTLKALLSPLPLKDLHFSELGVGVVNRKFYSDKTKKNVFNVLTASERSV